MKYLFILNDAPYGTERSYNALRLAHNLFAKDKGEVWVFLIGDAAACGKAGQKVPVGYYNIADMLSGVLRHGGAVNICGSCMDARDRRNRSRFGRKARQHGYPHGVDRLGRQGPSVLTRTTQRFDGYDLSSKSASGR